MRVEEPAAVGAACTTWHPAPASAVDEVIEDARSVGLFGGRLPISPQPESTIAAAMHNMARAAQRSLLRPNHLAQLIKGCYP